MTSGAKAAAILKLPKIKNISDLEKLIDKIGFLPFFANQIEGFSIEENIDPRYWFSEGVEGAWEWKGAVIRDINCAYGKFFGGKAGFISREWYPDFANFRRDGYDFDARYDDGLTRFSDKEVYDVLEKHGSLLSGELKRLGGFGGSNGKKGFDGIMTRLQKQGYVVIADFEYKRDKQGQPYGWGVARYSTSDNFFGKYLTENVYTKSPEQSGKKIFDYLSAKYPKIDEKKLRKFIEG